MNGEEMAQELEPGVLVLAACYFASLLAAIAWLTF